MKARNNLASNILKTKNNNTKATDIGTIAINSNMKAKNNHTKANNNSSKAACKQESTMQLGKK